MSSLSPAGSLNDLENYVLGAGTTRATHAVSLTSGETRVEGGGYGFLSRWFRIWPLGTTRILCTCRLRSLMSHYHATWSSKSVRGDECRIWNGVKFSFEELVSNMAPDRTSGSVRTLLWNRVTGSMLSHGEVCSSGWEVLTSIIATMHIGSGAEDILLAKGLSNDTTVYPFEMYGYRRSYHHVVHVLQES